MESNQIKATQYAQRNPTSTHLHEPTATPLLEQGSQSPQALHNWPTVPRCVKSSKFTTIWSLLVDITLLTSSVAFLAFALCVNIYDQAPSEDHKLAKDRLFSASKYGPTVFPILFAAVLSRATHAVLVWRIERGERTGVLDTLAGSTSLTSTVTSQFRLRMISFLGLILLIIWSLSPVGGQASIRQLGLGIRRTASSALYTYLVPNGNLDGFNDSGRPARWAVVNTLFNAAIIAPLATKVSPLDLWGNLKIPRIEFYEASTQPDENGWFDTKLDANIDTDVYSSLAGIPISEFDRPSYVDYKMQLQTLYMNLSCTTGTAFELYNTSNSTYVLHGTYNSVRIWWLRGASGDDSDHTDPYRNKLAIQNGSLDAFTFGYDASGSGLPLSVGCSVRTTYVEVDILCPTSRNCRAARIRRSLLPRPSANITQLDSTMGLYSNWYIFAGAFANSITSRSSYPSLIDYFIAKPYNPAIPLDPLNWQSLKQPPGTYATRLGQLINTYWTLANAPYAVSGGLTNETSWLEKNKTFDIYDFNKTFGGDYNLSYTIYNKARTWEVEGSLTKNTEILQAHKGWVAALSIASIILIVASLIPMFLRHFLIKGPDIMMNVSSLATRSNPFIPLPPTGTFLDASERARLLRDHKVRFGDFDGSADIGFLAVGSLETKDWNTARVRKGRMYE